MRPTDTPVPYLTLPEAIEHLRSGQVVAYPTETVWGLAALPEHAQALTQLKGREEGKPLQVSCPDAASALRLARLAPALSALSRFWPGPLTIITRAAPDCPPLLAPGGWIGLRVPQHPLALALLWACGPLATTSLNPAGLPPATTLAQAQAYGLAHLFWQGQNPAEQLVEGYPVALAPAPVTGEASTVVQLPDFWATPNQPLSDQRLSDQPGESGAALVRRRGAVSVAHLAEVLHPFGIPVMEVR